MNKVISMVNSEYFKYGKPFLETRKNVDADFVVYSPNLSESQIKKLEKYDIKHRHVDKDEFNNKMQYLKFAFMLNAIGGELDNSLITFCDWDTFFVKDWCEKIHDEIALGITYRNDLIKKKYSRAYANGGVIFIRNSRMSRLLCAYAFAIMRAGYNEDLPEYDEIWNTLESPTRAKHKRHYRTNLRWWVDQVLLSAFVSRMLKGGGDLEHNNLLWHGVNIRFYDCNKFNRICLPSSIKSKSDIYIGHLKDKSGAPANLKDGNGIKKS
jgi:hypothetical protein